jgi:isoamylase
VAFNSWSGDVSFTIPSPGSGSSWYRITNTCNRVGGPEAVAIPGSETWIGNAGASYTPCGRAVLLLIAK